MEQTKAINALEPFLALSKSATSPRAAADLITRATSSPNTFLFAELLQTPQIQALSKESELAPYLTLLQIFSYGTYQDYKSTPNLPPLSEAQSLKLRQLSLLTLACDRSNLSYNALQKSLELESLQETENLVVTAIYAGLLNATLDPSRQAVQVSSVAPLRDLSPGSIPLMISSLRTWADRCTSTLGELDEQVKSIRDAANVRDRDKRAADEKLQQLTTEALEADKKGDPLGAARDALARRGFNKRTMGEVGAGTSSETMDVDEPFAAEEELKRASKRKL